jgi:hypothetical protein
VQLYRKQTERIEKQKCVRMCNNEKADNQLPEQTLQHVQIRPKNKRRRREEKKVQQYKNWITK